MVVRNAVSLVGKAAMPELLEFYENCRDPTGRDVLLGDIFMIDPEGFMKLLLPRFYCRDRIAEFVKAQDFLVRYECITGQEPPVQKIADALTPALESPITILRIQACRTLAHHRAEISLERLREMAAYDQSPLVRFWASHAVQKIQFGGDVAELYSMHARPDETSPEEVMMAKKVYADVLKEMAGKHGEHEKVVIAHGSAFAKFSVLGSGVIPVASERLVAKDRTPLEVAVLRDMLWLLGAGLPLQVKQYYADNLLAAGPVARDEVLDEYRRLLRHFHVVWDAKWTGRPKKAKMVESLARSHEFSDQVLALAYLDAALDDLRGIRIRSNPWPSGRGPRGQPDPLREIMAFLWGRGMEAELARIPKIVGLCRILEGRSGAIGALSRELLAPKLEKLKTKRRDN